MFRELGVVDLFGVLDLGCAVHVLGGFCGREGGVGVWVCCSCLGCELSGGVMGCFVVGDFLCVRELLNVLAANGEQGEVGSDWCSVSCASLTCLGC